MKLNTKLDTTRFFPQVLQVIPIDDYKIYIYFNDGSIRLFDAKSLIKSGTVFEVLSDINIFKNKITIINDTVAWDLEGKRDPSNCIDLDPFVIFDLPKVKEPDLIDYL